MSDTVFKLLLQCLRNSGCNTKIAGKNKALGSFYQNIFKEYVWDGTKIFFFLGP